MLTIRPLSAIKRALVPAGTGAHRILFGLNRNLSMNLDFQSHTQVALGLNEREVAGWFRRLSADLVTAVDVGASEGYYTLFFLYKTPAKRVVAFEPDSNAAQRLWANVRLNGNETCGRLSILSDFVRSTDGSDKRCLSSVLNKSDLPCLIKIDIEGAEEDALIGAEELLKEGDSRWIIEVHSVDLERRCTAFLQAHGLKTIKVGPAWWRILLPELRPLEGNGWLVAFRVGAV